MSHSVAPSSAYSAWPTGRSIDNPFRNILESSSLGYLRNVAHSTTKSLLMLSARSVATPTGREKP